MTSLDKPIGDGRRLALGDLVADERSAVEEEVEVSLAAGDAPPGARELPEREREVLHLRYGLDGAEEPTRSRRSAAGSGSRASASARSRARALERLAVNREIEALPAGRLTRPNSASRRRSSAVVCAWSSQDTHSGATVREGGCHDQEDPAKAKLAATWRPSQSPPADRSVQQRTRTTRAGSGWSPAGLEPATSAVPCRRSPS